MVTTNAFLSIIVVLYIPAINGTEEPAKLNEVVASKKLHEAVDACVERTPSRVLVLGASGYLGQYLCDHFSESKYIVRGTYSTPSFVDSIANAVEPYHLNTGAGENASRADLEAYERLLESFQPNVVVNLIAISDPAACEKDEEKAAKVNLPTTLLQALVSKCPSCFLVHLSTDQIYDGDVGAPHAETAEPRPVNAYARTKLDAEKVVAEWPWHVILRSSAIYGPPPPRECNRKGTFLQAAISLLEGDEVAHVFTEEYRSFVHVADLVHVVSEMISRRHTIRTKTFNVGGHNGVSRADFVATVANLMDANTSNIVRITRKECPQPWAHKYPVPADIRMQVESIEQYLEVEMMDVLAGITRSLKF